MGSHVEIIDFSRPDGSRRNLFISGIPAALCEEAIVVGLKLKLQEMSVYVKDTDRISHDW